MKSRWKFLREGMKSEHGNCVWKKGEWKEHDGAIDMCSSGFHCSTKINQAFSFVPGEILAKVQVVGMSSTQTDKEVWSKMKVIKAWKWKKKDSVLLAIYAAELCLENFEKIYQDDKRPRLAIEAAKKWIENPADGAACAADSAARAAYSAARAAYSAACAAYSAADSAARAADSAARTNITEKINNWMNKHLAELEEITTQ